MIKLIYKLMCVFILTALLSSPLLMYGNEINYEKVCSFQEIEHQWTGDYDGEYNRPNYISYTVYDGMGKMISTNQVNGLCSVEKVARAIQVKLLIHTHIQE